MTDPRITQATFAESREAKSLIHWSLRAAEEVCYHILIHMSFGCDADTILRGCDELQTWANLAARDGKLHEDDPDGNEVSHAVPYPHGPVLKGYPA